MRPLAHVPLARYDAAMRHFPLKEIGYAIGFIVLLAAIYVGSYLAMVSKEIDIESTEMAVGQTELVINVNATYWFGGDWSVSFFRLVNDADRLIRPRYWAVDDPAHPVFWD
jgi:hypothetical protein